MPLRYGPCGNATFYAILGILDSVPDGEIQNGCKVVGCDDAI